MKISVMETPQYVIIHSPQEQTYDVGRYDALKLATKHRVLNEQTPITPELVYQPFLQLNDDVATRNELVAKLTLMWAKALAESGKSFEIVFALDLKNGRSSAPELSDTENKIWQMSVDHNPPHRRPTMYPENECEMQDISLNNNGDTVDLRHLSPFDGMNEQEKSAVIDALNNLTNNPSAIATIIESPFKGDVNGHLNYAYNSMVPLMERGHLPFGSHFIYTQVLDDQVERERTLGIYSGLEMYHVCPNSVYLLDMGASSGMKLAFDAQGKFHRTCEYMQHGNVTNEPLPESGLPIKASPKPELDTKIDPTSDCTLKVG